MTDVPANNEDASFIKWANGLRPVAAAVQERSTAVNQLAERVRNHPFDNALKDSVSDVARTVAAAAEQMSGWYSTLRGQNAEDFAAYFDPRGGVHTESRADAGPAHEGR